MRIRRRTIRNFLTLATLAAVGGATTVTHHLQSPAEAAVMQQVIDSGPVDILGGQSDANAKNLCINVSIWCWQASFPYRYFWRQHPLAHMP